MLNYTGMKKYIYKKQKQETKNKLTQHEIALCSVFLPKRSVKSPFAFFLSFSHVFIHCFFVQFFINDETLASHKSWIVISSFKISWVQGIMQDVPPVKVFFFLFGVFFFKFKIQYIKMKLYTAKIISVSLAHNLLFIALASTQRLRLSLVSLLRLGDHSSRDFLHSNTSPRILGVRWNTLRLSLCFPVFRLPFVLNTWVQSTLFFFSCKYLEPGVTRLQVLWEW